nr:MAG TPA: hypothetical protein [Caudoviricetes sp.]
MKDEVIREKKPHELIQTPKEQQIGEVFGALNKTYHIILAIFYPRAS